MTDNHVSVQEQADSLAAMIGGVGRAVAILAASLDQADIIDGRAVARSIRLDRQDLKPAQVMMEEIASLIDRIIDRAEQDGPLGLRPVPEG